MIAALSLLVCLAGLVMYLIASNPKVQTIGIQMFSCGLLAFLLTGGGAQSVKLLS